MLPRDLSIDEMSQSDESPAIPVPMVIACEANHDNSDGVDITDDISSPSLLFDFDTPVSMLPVTKPQFSISNSQAISMATEQDSVNTIPDTVETAADGEHMITMVTNPSCSDSEQLDDVDKISVANSNDAIGEIPDNDDATTINPEDDSSTSSVSSSCSHLLDHSYVILHDGVGGASSYEQLKCLEKVATMITPVPRKSSVLLKDNGCHAARCSAIKRSNRTLARVRRHQRQMTSLSPKKSQGMKMDTMMSSKHTSLPVEGVKELDVTVGTGVAEALSPAGSDGDDIMVDSVTSSVAKLMCNVEEAVTQPVVTMTQPMVTVTWPTSTVAQPVVTMTQPMVTMTQLVVQPLDSPSMVNCSQGGGDKVSHSLLAKPGGTMTQSVDAVTHRTDTATQPMDTVTNRTDNVTQSVNMVTHRTDTATQPMDTLTNRTDNVTQSVNTVTHRSDTATQPMDTVINRADNVTQSIDTVTRYTQKTADIGTQHTSSTSGSSTTDQQDVRYSQHNNITPLQQQSMLLPNLPPLQQCLVNQLAINTISTALHSIHGNNYLPCVSNQSLKGPSSIVTGDATSKMACFYDMLSSCLVSSEMAVPISGHHSITTSSMAHLAASPSQILPIIHNVFSNVNTNQLPFSNRQLPTIIRNRQPAIVNTQVTATTAQICSNLTTTNTSSPIITSLTSINTPSVMSLTSANTPVTSVMSNVLQSVNVPSVTSLTPVNSTSSTSVNSGVSSTPPITSLTSVNTASVTSLTSVNTPSVMSLKSVNSSLASVNTASVTSLTSVNTSAVMSLTSVNSTSSSANSSVTSLAKVNSRSFQPIQVAQFPNITVSTSVNSTPVMSNTLKSINPLSTLTSINTATVTSLTSVNTASVTSLTSINTSGVMSLTSVNSTSSSASSSVTSLAKVNSQSFQPIQVAQFPNITVSTSVNSTPVMSNTLKSLSSLTSVNTATVTSSISASISSVSTHGTNNSNKCSPLTLKQVEDIETTTSSSITSVTIGTVSQATASENLSCTSSKPVDNMESPPHTPTGGILKRVSQFDTPTTSGKVSVVNLLIFLIINMASEATSVIC